MATIAKPRYSVEGGYSRGEETRARIITAAMELFGERGFDGASTRDIAARAGVNAPALQYYFDNKEGVYLACAEQTASRVWDYLSEVVTRGERLLADKADDETLIEAFCDIQAQIAELMFTRPAAEGWRLMVAREQAGLGPARGFHVVYERVSKRIYSVTSAIIGRLLGRPADDDESLIRAMSLGGQLMFFSVMRRTALTALNWDAIEGDRVAMVKRLIVEQTRGLLRSMATARAESDRAEPSVQQ